MFILLCRGNDEGVRFMLDKNMWENTAAIDHLPELVTHDRHVCGGRVSLWPKM